jgi:hypothetical protein
LVLRRGVERNFLRDHFGYLKNCIEFDAAQNLTDLSVTVENFFRDLLNILLDANFENLNVSLGNAAAIDLADRSKRHCIQVTCTPDKSKIDETLKTFVDHGLDKQYDTLTIFIVTRKNAYRNNTFADPDRVFSINAREDIWDWRDIMRKADDLHQDRLSSLKNYVERGIQLPVANVTSKRNLKALLREQVAMTKRISIFSEETMNDLFLAEDYFIEPKLNWAESQKASSEYASSLKELIEAIESASPVTIIEGEAGMGKSVLAKVLTQQQIRAFESSEEGMRKQDLWLPYYLTGYIADQNKSFLASVINQKLFETGHRKWIIIIDGFDEIRDQDKRVKLLDFASTNITAHNDQIKFLIFSRPGFIQQNLVSDLTTRLNISPLENSQMQELVATYSGDAKNANNILERLLQQIDEALLAKPLFLAMAAFVNKSLSEDRVSRFEIIDCFVDELLERVQNRTGIAKTNLFEKLKEFAVRNDAVGEAITRGRIHKLLERERTKNPLQDSGIITTVRGTETFTHEVFREYFIALSIADTNKPSDSIWEKVDPFKVGWPVIFLLCEAWDSRSLCLTSTLRALTSLTSNAEDVAYELSVRCLNVNDSLRLDFANSILTEIDEHGENIYAEDRLYKLCIHSEPIIELLEDIASDEYGNWKAARFVACRCLLRISKSTEYLEFLNLVAQDRYSYFGDQLEAAKLLIELGETEDGIDALWYIAYFGDMLNFRIDAALTIYETTTSSEAKLRIKDLISEIDDTSDIYQSELGRLCAAGFCDFALPLLRKEVEVIEKIDDHDLNLGYILELSSALYSCEEIAKSVDKSLALHMYHQVLASNEWRSRQLSEILVSIKQSGFQEEFDRLVSNNEIQQRLNSDADWFSLKLIESSIDKTKALEISLSRLKDKILKEPYDCRSLVEALVSGSKKQEALDTINGLQTEILEPNHLLLFALCGEREKAKVELIRGRGFWSESQRILACRLLRKIGFGADATRVLLNLCDDCDNSGVFRLQAIIELNKSEDKTNLNLLAKIDVLLDCCQKNLLGFEDFVRKVNQEQSAIFADHVWSRIAPRCDEIDFNKSDDIDQILPILALHTNTISKREKVRLLGTLLYYLQQTENVQVFVKIAAALLGRRENEKAASIVYDRIRSDEIPLTLELVEVVCGCDWLAHSLKHELLKFASLSECDIHTEILILRTLVYAGFETDISPRLSELAKSKTLPVKWRFLAAGLAWKNEWPYHKALAWDTFDYENFSEFKLQPPHLLKLLINDDTIRSIYRLDILKKLHESQSESLKSGIIEILEHAYEHSSDDYIGLMEALAETGEKVRLKEELKNLNFQFPYSLSEIARLLKLVSYAQMDVKVMELIDLVLSFDPKIFEWASDAYSATKIVPFINSSYGKKEAVKFLDSVVSTEGDWWWEQDEFENAYIELGEENKASAIQTDLRKNNLWLDGEVNWSRLYGLERDILDGKFNEFHKVIELLENNSAPIEARIHACQLCYKFGLDSIEMDNLKNLAKGFLVKLTSDKKKKLHSLSLVELLNILGMKKEQNTLLDWLQNNAENIQERIRIGRKCEDIGLYEHAVSAIRTIRKIDYYINNEDLIFLEKRVGREALISFLEDCTANEKIPLYERIEIASIAAQNIGDKNSIEFLYQTSRLPDFSSSCLPDCAEYFFHSGMHKLAIETFEKVVDEKEVDHYWLAYFAATNLGQKEFARDQLLKGLPTFETDYKDQVCRLMADLQMTGALIEFEYRFPNFKD